MQQIIEHPTRVTHTSETLIDHIWVSRNCEICESNTTDGICDHHGIYAELKASMAETNKDIKVRSYKEYSSDKLANDYIEEIGKSNLRELVQQENIEGATRLWIDTVVSLCDKHAPEKVIKIKSKTEAVPWYDDNIHALMSAKNKALQKVKRYGNRKQKLILKSITNKLKNYKRKKKREYFQEKIEEQTNNPKRLWSILKEVTGTESPCDETLPDMVNKDTVNTFNSYFAKVGKNIQNQLGVHFEFSPNNNPGFCFGNETPETVKKLINRIKTKVATGYDRIPSRIIKDLSEVAASDIATLINLSYKTCTFPSQLKHAIIRTIFKNKGNCNEPEFYRPISVLSIISKIFERSATDQIIGYLEENDKLYDGQHAYRRKHSTASCLIEITDYIHSKLEEKKLVGLVSTDLSKAFDTLSHPQLLSKLQGLGFGASSVNWIRSYLTNRTQQVKMNGVLSDESVVEAGVPQGSILGPVLFIAFTADFSKSFEECKITAYADDTQLLVVGNSVGDIKEKVEAALSRAQGWFSANSLKINPTKSEIMIFGRKKDQEQININVQEDGVTKYIQTTSKMKILGVIIDDKLTWESHIKKIRRQTHNTITNIARTSNVLPITSRRTLYDALVTPHFNYCDVVWDGTTKKWANELQKSGNFAAKALLGRRKSSSATAALNRLDMMPLCEKRKVHLGVFIHKIVNHNGPKETTIRYMSQMERSHGYRTRTATRGDFKTLSHHTTKFDSSTLQRATRCWNSIPLNIRQIETTSSFKRAFQKSLLTKYQKENWCCQRACHNL